MANEKSELKNPIFICFIILLIGIGLGVWGWIKEDCIGPDCWKGSGFLKWTGIALIAIGLGGWALFGSRKEKR